MMTVPRVRRSRRGMTLVEIMIALVLLGIISGVVMRVIMRQQRFYQGANQIMTQRSQLRQATSVLPVDLRSLSSIGDDILAVSDTSIDFRMNVATGVICDLLPGGAGFVLPPENLDGGQTLTSFFGYGYQQLKQGEGFEVFVYNDSNTVGNEEDAWKLYELDANVKADNSYCPTSFAKVTDFGKARYEIKVSDPDGYTDPVTGGPVSQYIQIGAPVRIVRKVRYALYKESDGKWYLGYANYNAGTSAWETLAPVSGPYDPYSSSSGTPSGLGFKYYDVDGNEIASGATQAQRQSIARIDLVARARTATNVRTGGIQNGLDQQYKDSLAVSVMLRNRQ